MDVNKAIRKQNRSYKRFMLIMCFIFFMLPLVLYLSDVHNLFLITYLALIEILIILALLFRRDSVAINYSCVNGQFKFSQGLIKKNFNINCEKVVFVHAEKNEERDGIDIIILTNSRFRNKNMKMVDQEFLKSKAYVSHEYKRIKLASLEEQYYYVVISKGGWIKYKILMELYKNCVRAKYSDEAIEAIKQCNN